MKLSAPKWLRTADATVEELQRQLAAAQAQLDEAQQVEDAARTAFDERGDSATEQAFRTAQTARETAALHVGRAGRLLKAAREREREAEQERLRQREGELQKLTSRAAIVAAAAPLVDAEVQAIETLASVREQRLQQRDHFRALEAEHATIRLQLGEDEDAAIRRTSEADYAVSYFPVVEKLQQLTEGLGADNPRRQLIEALMPCPAGWGALYGYGTGGAGRRF